SRDPISHTARTLPKSHGGTSWWVSIDGLCGGGRPGAPTEQRGSHGGAVAPRRAGPRSRTRHGGPPVARGVLPIRRAGAPGHGYTAVCAPDRGSPHRGIGPQARTTGTRRAVLSVRCLAARALRQWRHLHGRALRIELREHRPDTICRFTRHAHSAAPVCITGARSRLWLAFRGKPADRF